ncbi:MAG: TIGR01777 family oxidoreductase [Anaerolineaceae bacterium]
MRVVIIGGAGMIGQALSTELRENKHLVTILTRGDHRAQQSTETWLKWDGRDSKRLSELLQAQDAVVNLAGESIGKSRWTKKRKTSILESRTEPGKAISKAIAMMPVKPKVVIQASAVGFYGTVTDVVDEQSSAGRDWLAGVCQEWEKALSVPVSSGTRLVFLRSGIVLAREGGVLGQMELPVRMFVGGPLGGGQQWISWIHLKDEVRAIRFLLENQDCQGIFNLTSPNPVTNRFMEKTLAKVLHRPYWLPLPAFVLKLGLGEMSTLVLDGQKVLPARLLQAGYRFKFIGLEDALIDLFK